MATDQDLVPRMRALLTGAGNISEMKMFGGIAFMLNGNMLASSSKRGLMLRVGKEQAPNALTRPGTRQIEMRGRPMEGYIRVDPAGNVFVRLKLSGFVSQSPSVWIDMLQAMVN